MKSAHIIGLDIAKDVFHLHAIDREGSVVVRRKLQRKELAPYIRSLKPCLIGMEASCGSHYWARQFSAMGHDVRLMPAAYVKAYVKLHKNDTKDAEAICEAVHRPTMRFVPAKTEAQQASLLLHRVRNMLIGQKTMLANALRSHLAEFGIVKAAGRAGITEVLDFVSNLSSEGLPQEARAALQVIAGMFCAVKDRIEHCEKQILECHKENENSRRLASIPGIGPLTASAIVATIGNAKRFQSGRQFSAWLGLVPRQFSTGGKARLGRITRAGDHYLRKLLFMGASSLMRICERSSSHLMRWAKQLKGRKPFRLAAVALAAKLARIAWALLAKNEDYCAAR